MKRSIVARLHDMLSMIDAAGDMAHERSFSEYKADIQFRLAIERSIEIVSEASRHVPEVARSRFPDIPWPEIASIGNKLRHEYNRVDDLIIWRVATESLPKLRPVILAILNDPDA